MVKTAKSGEIDYNSSFEEIGNIIGELVIDFVYEKKCNLPRAPEFSPVILYDKSIMKSQANWNYIFIKRCIWCYLRKHKWNENLTEQHLNRKYSERKYEISKAKSDVLTYLNDLKIADVLDGIIKTLNRITPRTLEFCMFNRIYIRLPMEIFPPADKFQSLDNSTKKWWKPSPNIGSIPPMDAKLTKRFSY